MAAVKSLQLLGIPRPGYSQLFYHNRIIGSL
jgi:hypothetical protein